MAAAPQIREVLVRPVRLPMEYPHQTASGAVSESPLVLTDVVTDDGARGHGIVFTYNRGSSGPLRYLTSACSAPRARHSFVE